MIIEPIEYIDLTQAGEIEKRPTSPEAIEGIAYIQQSLDEAFEAQKRFFEDKKAN